MLKIFLYLLIFFTLFILYLTNSIVHEPYMDEIFHFPQAVKYYKGIYNEWDPKITTPPGLYLFTVAILKPLSKLTTLDTNKIACFRLVNVIFLTGTLFAVLKIHQHLHRDNKQRVALLSSFNIATFPVLYFFNFLYYTDSGSTFLILLMYYWHLKKSYYSAAFAGAVSILFRQTNIVWVFYVAADETLHTMLHLCNEGLSKKDKTPNWTSFSDLKILFVPLWKNNWRTLLKILLKINLGYITVAVGFFSFLYLNGSLALGDKSAHQVCLHVPQLLYFALFFLCFSFPYLISFNKMMKFLRFVSTNQMFVFEATLFCGIAILFMSHAHPYLLADNRHLTFYIWRKLLGRSVFLSLALIPVYIYSAWSIAEAVQHKDVTFRVLIAFCIAISVIPQKLLEFRYFIIPYIMLHLHLKVQSHFQPYLEFLLYTAVNFVVLYLFLFQKLPWSDAEKEARIMW